MEKSRLMSLLLTAAGLLFCGSLSAQKQESIISDKEFSVNASLIGSPKIRHTKELGERSEPYKWLLVKIAYRFRSPKTATFDDMRCEIYLHTIATGKDKGWKRGYWITGTQYFYSVIRDKEIHYVTMFVPPSLVYKCSFKHGPEMAKNLEGIAVFYNGDKKLGSQVFSCQGKGSMDKKRRGLLIAAYHKINENPNKIVNGLWPREKTPWQWLDADRYDLPRTTFENGKTSSGPKDQEAASADTEGTKTSDGTKNASESSAESSEESEVSFTRSSGKKNKKNKRNQ